MSGYICPCQQYLSCYWSDFDQISLDQNFFQTPNFWTSNFGPQNLFEPNIFLDLNFFRPKIFLQTQHFLPKIFLKKFFLAKNLFVPERFWTNNWSYSKLSTLKKRLLKIGYSIKATQKRLLKKGYINEKGYFIKWIYGCEKLDKFMSLSVEEGMTNIAMTNVAWINFSWTIL